MFGKHRRVGPTRQIFAKSHQDLTAAIISQPSYNPNALPDKVQRVLPALWFIFPHKRPEFFAQYNSPNYFSPFVNFMAMNFSAQLLVSSSGVPVPSNPIYIRTHRFPLYCTWLLACLNHQDFAISVYHEFHLLGTALPS